MVFQPNSVYTLKGFLKHYTSFLFILHCSTDANLGKSLKSLVKIIYCNLFELCKYKLRMRLSQMQIFLLSLKSSLKLDWGKWYWHLRQFVTKGFIICKGSLFIQKSRTPFCGHNYWYQFLTGLSEWRRNNQVSAKRGTDSSFVVEANIKAL